MVHSISEHVELDGKPQAENKFKDKEGYSIIIIVKTQVNIRWLQGTLDMFSQFVH